MINQFLMSLSDEARATIYDISGVAMMAVFFAVIVIFSYKGGNKLWKSLLGGVLALVAYYAVAFLAGLREDLTNSAFYTCGVIEFAPFVLCSAIPVSLILKCKWLDALDKTAPALMLGLAVQGIGCCLTGCCQGEAVSWGIYSGVYKTTVVPVQVVECIVLFVLWTIIYLYYRKKKYHAGGRVGALALICFGMVNVLTDAFTVTFPTLIFENSLVGVIAFATMCLGLIMLYLLDRKTTKEKNAEREEST